jgi:hypothetical protein
MAPRAVFTSHEPFSNSVYQSKTSCSQLTFLHLRDQVLVKQTSRLLVQRAVNCDNVALCQHLLEILNPSAANLLLLLRAQRLVVEVQQLLAVEGLETPQHTLANTANGHCAHNLVLQIVLILRDFRDVPLTRGDLLVGRNEIADEGEDSHNNVLSDGDDVRACDFGDGDTAIGFIRRIKIDVVGSDTSCYSELEILGLGKALSGEVTRVKAVLHNY